MSSKNPWVSENVQWILQWVNCTDFTCIFQSLKFFAHCCCQFCGRWWEFFNISSLYVRSQIWVRYTRSSRRSTIPSSPCLLKTYSEYFPTPDSSTPKILKEADVLIPSKGTYASRFHKYSICSNSFNRYDKGIILSAVVIIWNVAALNQIEFMYPTLNFCM